ncbi:uncharacterized protein LOC126896661 isoform X2 [Daktulosphaira vitifoliae]|uniref:uncharacterized protein LOC126896661 isoform X2 n=1 Tax=Daktulosphaira vitifoliae TaxID=58002 RepID=UPI0021AA20BA|nr:uncharacterized protein LOC126896661 isoform X2 [Daktulosphaira vitifoliae]
MIAFIIRLSTLSIVFLGPPLTDALHAGASANLKNTIHNLENHQYKDSRKCLLPLADLKRTVKRHTNKRQQAANSNHNYEYYDDGGGGVGEGGGGGGSSVGDIADGILDDYYDPDLITDPRDRMLPVIYNPRPLYAAPGQLPQQTQQQQVPLSETPYNRYQDETNRIANPFEIPIIECPPTEDGFERFACPTPDKEGRFRCIDDHVLCDGYIDCPNGDDEDRKNCFFFKTTKAHLDILADALLRWARGR